MKTKHNRRQLISALAFIAAAIAMAAPAVKSQGRATVKVDGSSTVFPITEAVAEEFQNKKRGAVRVTVGISGTGGGFKKFCAGETHISNASRPIKSSEIELCKRNGIEFIEIPVAYDAITVVINPNNTWARSMTVDELKKLWEPSAEGRITKWSQIRSGWPDAPISLFGPGTDSGTFDYFTDEIVGESGASRADYTASEDDNILVLGVSRNQNALGYFGYAYYDANRSAISSVAVNNVQPSSTTVNNGSYTPLSRPIYIYVSKQAAEIQDVREFVEYYLTDGTQFVSEVAYVPLSSSDYQAAMRRFRSRQTGAVRLRNGL